MLRSTDKLRLHELHPSDNKLLVENMKTMVQRRAHIEKTDGFTGLKSIMPPPTKRSIVLIDPPYEDKQDYRTVVRTLKECLKRFSSGTYAVWYPQLTSQESKNLPNKLKNCGADSWLHVSLSIKGAPKGKGMYGSGMFVINPPYVLVNQLKEALPIMKTLMCDPLSGSVNLEFEGI